MVLPPSFSGKMGEIETVGAEKMGWLDLPRGTSYPTFPYGFFKILILRGKFFKKKKNVDNFGNLANIQNFENPK